MKQAIENFCRSTDTGLFLLDMPTGFIVYWILWSTIMMRLNSRIRRFSLLQPLRKICLIRSYENILQSAEKKMIMINTVCE